MKQSGVEMTNTISIVIPLYNQLAYTRGCLESLATTIPSNTEVVVVDNASSDGTAEYLKTIENVVIISNAVNRGFAGACNQGIQAATGEWIVVMNNDVILSSGWLEGMLLAAGARQLDMVSPAIREGALNYPFGPYAAELTGRMKHVVRLGQVNGICFMAHRRVFETIGVFDENFHIGQYEDKDLFLRARKAGFRLGTVGAAFIHHFGSITQKSLGVRRQARDYALANKAYFIRKWKVPWWKRALQRNWDKLSNLFCCTLERLQCKHSLVEKFVDGRLRYY